MEEKVSKIKEVALKEIEDAKDVKSLEDIRVKYLGKKGELTALLKMMGELSPEERPRMGSLVNSAKFKSTKRTSSKRYARQFLYYY